jgi:2-keto-4-pentenoate hydratase
VVLGGRLATDASDLRLVGMTLARGGELVATGAGARVLGHPAQSVAWLANALSGHDLGLQTGEIVLSGSLATPMPARPGDVFTAELYGLGSVTARFA